MPTNFDLAPPGKIVDGLAAVPIDIQQITATLTFDGAASSGTGDATIVFVVGPGGGCPIFDLRQTITGVFLDGVPLAPGDVAMHDFGGGSGAGLRVLNRTLAADSSHTLRLLYTLGPPQASTAGSYRPAMTWAVGPRLTFNFGFTDLGPGRYLESWVPANLIFDQFDLMLELRVINTAIGHTPITNGVVTTLGANHWSVLFAPTCTALSTLVELRASDTVTSQTGSVVLPISGVNIALEAWKLVGATVDLAARLGDMANFLIANEASTGPYLHGSRFVAFFHLGGMEYDGGTTTSASSLRHETFHSWWGRGVKPASQADGWWDEAWTVYNDAGAVGSLPFDFGGVPVELSSRNPWVRITPGASYSSGERFFEGAAGLMGASNLTSSMSDFYRTHGSRPTTTLSFEEYLVSRCGDPALVDGFHRFVYGFPDPAPAPDLWIKDDPGDSGSHLWAGAFWNSPDLWIRNADDGGTTHQPPEYGQDNWFYARVRNRSASGTARHFVVTFNAKAWSGTEFVFPADFLPCTAAAAGFDLGPGETRIVKARWPHGQVPPPGTHVCWVAAALCRTDRPSSGAHVWEHNNLAQKNLTVVDVVPGQWIILPFVIGRLPLRGRRGITLQLHRPSRWNELDAAVLHSGDVFVERARPVAELLERDAEFKPKRLVVLDCGGGLPGGEYAFDEAVGLRFARGRRSRLLLWMRSAGQRLLGLALRVPDGARPGESPVIDLVQWDHRRKRVVGGLAVIVRVSLTRVKRRELPKDSN